MAAFEAMCEGFLGIGVHWHLFQHFFRFSRLREGSRAATIGCVNLRMKQGRDDNYIPAPLTSSNSGWHMGWYYLRIDPSTRSRRTPGAPSRSCRGTGPMARPRKSRRRCSSLIGLCSSVFGTPGSPWRRWSGSTTPEESCRSGGGRSGFAT
jgi:hypothetical protein